MDQRWKSALILVPLILVVAGIWMFRSRPDPGEFSVCTSPPGQPADLEATVSSDAPGVPDGMSRITLTWTPPTTGDAPTMYVIEAGTAPGASNVGNYVSNVPTFATDAPAGIYYGRVRAQNACGASDPSGEVEVRVP